MKIAGRVKTSMVLPRAVPFKLNIQWVWLDVCTGVIVARLIMGVTNYFLDYIGGLFNGKEFIRGTVSIIKTHGWESYRP